jgi:hypothetical protein
MIRAALLMVAMLVLVTASAAAQLKTPVDWKWRIEGATGSVVAADPPKPADTRFVAMPPGWHVTTGPATVLYHPDYQAKGNFTVEAEIFLFPGESQEEYGVFLGGKGLGPTETPSYVSFVARRDGKAAIIRRFGPPVLDWKANDAILPGTGTDAVKNVLRVDVNATDVVFTANGKEVATIPRARLNVDGYFEFRFGKGMNAHASRLDITHKLAPVPNK